MPEARHFLLKIRRHGAAAVRNGDNKWLLNPVTRRPPKVGQGHYIVPPESVYSRPHTSDNPMLKRVGLILERDTAV